MIRQAYQLLLNNAFNFRPRLPWRMTQWMRQKRLELMRRYWDLLVRRTPEYETGVDSPHFEVHVLLSHRHVGMTLWCIKSFLFQARKKYVVVLHDDGTLTHKDCKILKTHLANVQIVRRAEGDAIIHNKLMSFPSCRKYRFTQQNTSDHRGRGYDMHIYAIRLFDFNLLSSASKTLVLDCDVLFFAPPLEIMAWADTPDDVNSLYSVEQYRPSRDPLTGKLLFEKKDPVPVHANAGLLCFDKRGYDLEAIETWISSRLDLMNTAPTFEQQAYNHLLERRSGSKALPDSYAFNYTDSTVIATHFALKDRFFANLYRIDQAITES